MLREIAVAAILLLVTAGARADEAGRILFSAGDVRVGGRAAAHGQAVGEGDEIATGADGYVHVKAIDNGVLILRPSSRARVTAYHVDPREPQNTRIKLDLFDGTARSISGEAVKQARQNFRFNTPVAAIGVRGTDFTVFTDQTTTRVSVAAGGVVVSGFDGPCTPQGGGPCEGGGSRELFAGQSGQLLQVTSGQPVPQLLREPAANNSLVPAAGAANNRAANTTVASSGDALNPQIEAKLLSGATLSGVSASPPSADKPTPAPAYQQIIWGRWQALAGPGATVDVATMAGVDGRILAVNSLYAIGRSGGVEWPVPQQGVMDFALLRGEGYIVASSGATAAAAIENGRLQIDFGKTSFTTGFDLVSAQGERFMLKAVGDVAANGQLLGASQFSGTSNMAVSGAVGAGNAAYIFQGRLDDLRQAFGGASWIKR